MMNSRDYWTERERAHADNLKQDAENKVSEMKREYYQALEDIQNDINRNYVNYMNNGQYSMSDAMKLADKMDVERFANKIDRYISNNYLSEQAMQEFRLYNLKMRVSRLQLIQIEIGLEIDRLNHKVTSDTEQYLINQAEQEYKRQAGILGENITFNAKTISALVNASYKTNTEGQVTFSENIWGNTERLKSELKTTLNKVILQGKNPNQFNKQFRDIFNKQQSRIGTLLITETARLQGDVQLDSINQANYDYYDVITERKACALCQSVAKNNPFEVSKAEIGVNMYPFHPNCLCSIVGHD